VRIVLHNNATARLLAEHGEEIAGALQRHAERVRDRIRPPASAELVTYARSGIGRQGPFAQAGMRGPGAVAIEFGSRQSPPQALVRRAIGAA
jgi:hypothetical protein